MLLPGSLAFSLKKVLSIGIMPVTITLLLILVGLVLLLFARTRRNWEGKRRHSRLGVAGWFCIAVGSGLLYLCSLDPIAHGLVLGIEKKAAPPLDLAKMAELPEKPEAIVVLAGGQWNIEGKPALSKLTHKGLARMVAAVELWRLLPDTDIFVTGHPPETSAMRGVAEALGVPPERIIEESESRDTKDHAVFLKPLLADRPFLLVTSALHLPRASGLFRGQGLDPIDCPVDFIIWPGGGDFAPHQSHVLIPRSANIHLTTLAWHEMIGTLWARLRGQMGG